MAFSNFFKNAAKNKTDATITVGAALPKQYKPQKFDLWAKISGDGQNVLVHAFDDLGNPKGKGQWQRSPKTIVSATDPASSPTLIASNGVQTNDIWVNTSGATSAFKVWTGTAWK